MPNPVAWWRVSIFFFCTERLGTSCHRFYRSPKQSFEFRSIAVLCACWPCTFTSHLSCYRSHYKSLHASVSDCWLHVLLSLSSVRISSETVFALSRNDYVGKMFWQHTNVPPRYTPSWTVRAVCSAANSRHSGIHWYHLLLSSYSHSRVGRVSKCYVFCFNAV